MNTPRCEARHVMPWPSRQDVLKYARVSPMANSMYNPARTNFDWALLKDFKVLGDRSLQFRMEAFNIFNTTQFRIYDPVKGYSVYFGSATLPVGRGAWVYSPDGGTATATAQ
jgi:hypothetical protein